MQKGIISSIPGILIIILLTSTHVQFNQNNIKDQENTNKIIESEIINAERTIIENEIDKIIQETMQENLLEKEEIIKQKIVYELERYFITKQNELKQKNIQMEKITLIELETGIEIYKKTTKTNQILKMKYTTGKLHKIQTKNTEIKYKIPTNYTQEINIETKN